MFAAEAKPLSDIMALGVGNPNTEDWKDNLKKCNCANARIFIPIDWSGK